MTVSVEDKDKREYFAYPLAQGRGPQNQASVEIFGRNVKGNVATQSEKLATVRAVIHTNGVLQVVVDRPGEVGTVDTLFTLEDNRAD